MFGIMYEVDGEKVFRIFKEYGGAFYETQKLINQGYTVTMFDYDVATETYMEFYTTKAE